MKKIIDKLITLVFPNRCISCGIILTGKHKWLCEKCKADFSNNNLKRCRICDRIIYRNGNCRVCNSTKRYFDRGYSVLEYKGAVRNAIMNYKYRGLHSYGKFFGSIMSYYALDNIADIKDYDYITAVPLHRKRYRFRGYNQSEILAKAVSKSIGIKYAPLIVRKVNTRPLNSLGREERLKEIKGAFALKKGVSVENKNILIVDDIYTTGNTVNECCKVFKQNKAAIADFFTLSCRSED